MSTPIGDLALALAKAQGEIQHAHKDKNNPFFKSTYADLASVWDACREPLSKNGLSVVQICRIDATGKTILVTSLLHASGQWIITELPVSPVDNKPQSMGSALTYMRRFALSALVGVAPSDDDGNEASGRSVPPGKARIEPKPDKRPLNDSEKENLKSLGKSAGLKTNVELNALVVKMFNHPLADLTLLEYGKVCDELVARTPVSPMELK